MSLERPQKRGRYVAKACNQCKRRKTKCDGQEPCGVCARKRSPCQYRDITPPVHGVNDHLEPDTVPQSVEEHSQIQMTTFDDRLRILEGLTRSIHAAVTTGSSSSQRMDNVHNERDSECSSEEDSSTLQSFPYAGPSSSQYILQLVRDSLNKTTSQGDMSSTGGFVGIGDAVRPRRRASSSATTSTRLRTGSSDTLLSLGSAWIAEACQTYAALVGSMYPLVDSDYLEARSKALEQCSQHEARLLKAVVAIGEALKVGDRSEVSERLVADLASDTSRSLYCRRPSVQDIQLWGLIALYHVHIGEAALSSRFIGLAARSCLEAGWHQSETLKRLFPVTTELSAVMDIFWSIYLLDRRASLGLGIPYIMSDIDIDQKLPAPPNSYLKCMLEFARLSGKAQQSINSHIRGAHSFSKDDVDFLSFQIERWYENIPSDLNLCASDGDRETIHEDGTIHFLRLVLFARKNQGLLLVYRPSLISAKSAAENPKYVRNAVKIAIETIVSLADNDAMYTRQQVVFNHFVLSALAILVLAAHHAPEEFSTGPVKKAFQRGTQLLKDGCKVSQVTSRLWERVKDVERLGASLKLSALVLENVDTSSTEAEMEGNLPVGEVSGTSEDYVDLTSLNTLDFDSAAEGNHSFSDLLNFTNLGDMFLQEAIDPFQSL